MTQNHDTSLNGPANDTTGLVISHPKNSQIQGFHDHAAVTSPSHAATGKAASPLVNGSLANNSLGGAHKEMTPVWSLVGMTESASGFWTREGTFPEDDVLMPDLYGTGALHHHLIRRPRGNSASSVQAKVPASGFCVPKKPEQSLPDDTEESREQQEPARAEYRGSATLGSSTFNLASTAVGAGALGLPFALAQTGTIIGLALNIFSAVVTVYSIWLLVTLVERHNSCSFESLALKAFGRPGKVAMIVTIIALMWGVSCMYVLIIGSLMSPVQKSLVENTSFPEGYWGTKIIQFIFWLVFMLPLCLLKEMDSLKAPSTIAVCAVFFVLLAMLLQAIIKNTSRQSLDNIVLWPPGGINFILALNNIKVAYAVQTTTFPIYAEMKKHTIGNMMKATTAAMLICLFLYVAAGMFGLAAFGPTVKGNVLDSFADPFGEWYIILAYLCMTFTITISFPIVMFPTRDAVLQAIGYRSAYVTPPAVRMGVSFALALSALIVGMFVPSINLFFGVIGGIGGNLISFVFPATLALKLGFSRRSDGMAHMAGIFVLLIMGLVLGPIGTGVAVYSEFTT